MDPQRGIKAKYFMIDSTDKFPEIIFFEFVGEEEPKKGFDVLRRDIHKSQPQAIELGSPNDSGAFGNTQEFFTMGTNSGNVNVVRVANTIACLLAHLESIKRADEFFELIGYRDKQ